MGLDGPAIEEEFCKELWIGHMIAPAQVPAREFLEDVYYAVTRVAKTTGRLGGYVRWGRSSDVGVFRFPANLGKKGSSAMPHKDMMGGNPDKEEQAESIDHVLAGVLCGSLEALSMDYARDLTGSALDRIFLDIAFKCTDCSVRNMAGVMDKLTINPERSKERILRTCGTITSPRFLAYLTDGRNGEPMARSEAHDLLGKLATEAYNSKKMFSDVLKANPVVSAKITPAKIDELSDPLTYVGESKKVVENVYDAFHGKRTF
jgi:adenylosuccinate lyase